MTKQIPGSAALKAAAALDTANRAEDDAYAAALDAAEALDNARDGDAYYAALDAYDAARAAARAAALSLDAARDAYDARLAVKARAADGVKGGLA